MKSFYHSSYRFYHKDQSPVRIFAISDVHFNDAVKDSLTEVLHFAEKYEPDLITISGDLIDSNDSLDTTSERARLKTWLEHLGAMAPVLICLGNHDFFRNDFERGRVFQQHSALNDELKDLKNVYLLDDTAYEDDHFYVFGLTLPPEYYEGAEGKSAENLPILQTALDNVATQLVKLPAHKTKILLTHSPVHLTDKSVKKQLASFDLVLAGHMHNGVVPPLLHDLWRSRTGIFSPTKEFFKNYNSRLGLYDDKVICLGAITTIQPKTKLIGWGNRVFPTYIATIEITHNTADERKPDVKHKYEKW